MVERFPRPFRSAVLALAASLLAALGSGPAFAALGDCGQPVSNGTKSNAADALAILRTAVGQTTPCAAKPCICDVNGNGPTNAADALYALKIAVGQVLPLLCMCMENQAPTADAGDDAAVLVGVPSMLDGSGSSDPDADPLDFSWTIVDGPPSSLAFLDGADTATPTILADLVGSYTVELTVSDGVETSTDQVVVEAISDILVEANPPQFVTGVTQQVRVQAQVTPSATLDPMSVRVVQVDAAFEPTGETLCTLLDNGNLANGDDIAADGVYSCFLSILQPVPGVFHLVAEALYDAVPVRSGFVLTVVDPLSEAEAELVAETQGAADAIWQNKLAELGDTPEARAAAAAEIAELEGVAEAGVSEDGQTIWIHYDNGVLGGLMLNPEGTRGAALSAPAMRAAAAGQASAFARPFSTSADVAPAGFERLPSFSSFGADLMAEPAVVESNNVLIWDAYNSQFAPFDEGPGLQMLFANSPCPKFNVTYMKDAACDVDSVATFAAYGTIILVTHGAVDGNGQVVFLTRETASVLGILANTIDLLLGRVSIMGDVFAIRPSFISSLSGTFPKSIVYNGSCQSSANPTMANAFHGKGARSYYAFTRVVNSDFAQSVATQLFTNLVTGAMNTVASFTPVTPKVDPKSPFATFTHSTTETVEYTGKLLNGGFEKGDLTGWSKTGDGRVVTALGPITPTEGNYMGLISTGLGFTVSAGQIEQNFCLPKTTSTIDFDWNFNSEEFVEWCFQGFSDFLKVDLVTDSGTTTLLSRNVDGLCASVIPTTLFFDQSGPACVPIGDGSVGSTGNDCKVWGTGWNFESIDVSALAMANDGKGVTLRFQAGDIGDSIFDTAVLIDDVRVETP